jgi:hypothetical protein
MARNIIFLKMYYRHKHLDIIYKYFLFKRDSPPRTLATFSVHDFEFQ